MLVRMCMSDHCYVYVIQVYNSSFILLCQTALNLSFCIYVCNSAGSGGLCGVVVFLALFCSGFFFFFETLITK